MIDRDEDDVGLELLDLAADLRLDDDRAAALLPADRLGLEVDLAAVLLDLAGDDVGALLVDAVEDPLEALEDDELGAGALEGLAELEADDPAADAEHPLRDVVEVERAGRVEDPLLVDLEAGDLDRQRAGGDDDVLGLDDVGRAAVGVLDPDRAGADELGRAVDVGRAVALDQALDAGRQLLDDPGLPGLHRLHVDGGALEGDPHRRAVLRLVIELGRRDQRLRGDAADVEADAAGLVLLDDHRVDAELGEADRAGVAAGAGADDEGLLLDRGHGELRGWDAARCRRGGGGWGPRGSA